MPFRGLECKCTLWQSPTASLWKWVKCFEHLLQRPFDSNLRVDGNRLATFLNYVSTGERMNRF